MPIPLGRVSLPVVGLLVAVLACGSLSAPAHAVADNPEPSPSPAAASAALEEVQSILEPTAAQRAEQRTEDAGGADGGRDLTVALRDLRLRQDELSTSDRAAAKQLLPTRPVTDVAQDFGSVRVHWKSTDQALTPAWVAQVGQVVNNVLTTYQAAGYRAPLSDGNAGGGSGLFDIYLVDFAAEGQAGLYGYCDAGATPPRGGPYNTSAFCAFDHDFASFPRLSPLDNLKVTAAHELFHATQFAYDYYEDAWFMEATATWAEDEVYDSINDNRQYLSLSPLRQPRQPLDQFSRLTLRHYGEWIFFRYLSERYPRSQGGMPVILRRMWELADGSTGAPDEYSIKAVNKVLRSHGTDLRRVYAAFGDANRRPSRSYEEGSHYPKANPARAWTLTKKRPQTGLKTLRLAHLSTATVQARPSKAMKRWRLRVSVDLPNKARGVAAIVTRYDKSGRSTQQMLRLSKAGNGSKVFRFDARTVNRVELTLSNAGIRYRCGAGASNGVMYSCNGTSRDDNLPMRFRLKASR